MYHNTGERHQSVSARQYCVNFSFILPPATFISEFFQDQCPATDAASNTEYFQLVVLYFSGS